MNNGEIKGKGKPNPKPDAESKPEVRDPKPEPKGNPGKDSKPGKESGNNGRSSKGNRRGNHRRSNNKGKQPDSKTDPKPDQNTGSRLYPPAAIQFSLNPTGLIPPQKVGDFVSAEVFIPVVETAVAFNLNPDALDTIASKLLIELSANIRSRITYTTTTIKSYLFNAMNLLAIFFETSSWLARKLKVKDARFVDASTLTANTPYESGNLADVSTGLETMCNALGMLILPEKLVQEMAQLLFTTYYQLGDTPDSGFMYFTTGSNIYGGLTPEGTYQSGYFSSSSLITASNKMLVFLGDPNVSLFLAHMKQDGRYWKPFVPANFMPDKTPILPKIPSEIMFGLDNVTPTTDTQTSIYPRQINALDDSSTTARIKGKYVNVHSAKPTFNDIYHSVRFTNLQATTAQVKNFTLIGTADMYIIKSDGTKAGFGILSMAAIDDASAIMAFEVNTRLNLPAFGIPRDKLATAASEFVGLRGVRQGYLAAIDNRELEQVHMLHMLDLLS